MKPTIYDVAEKAGVSIATVSKVINETGRISKETREKVLRIMQELDYQPSMMASALTGKQTFTLGLLLPDLANPFFAEMARSIEDRAHELGFNVMICSTDNDPEREARNLSFLKQKRVDGIIIVATGIQSEAVLRDLVKQRIPVLLLSRDLPAINIDTVLVDDFLGGYLAAKHFIEKGHRQIAMIAEEAFIASSAERIRGYRHALEEAGISYNEALVKECDANFMDAKRVTAELIDSPNPPTAIFAHNDLIATGVIQAAREKGLALPEDLSVIGFDNTIHAMITSPPLTTIAQPIQEMGSTAVDLITRSINDSSAVKQRIVMHPELVVRSSVANLTSA